MINYSIKDNEQYNSKEVYFEGMPEKETRENLKALGFRWNNKKVCWYGFADNADIEKACQGGKVEKLEKPARVVAVPSVDRERLTNEFAMVWGGKDAHMTKYCVGVVTEVAELPSGEIITIDKQKIETRFCFGESGYDYDEAQHMAAHARTNEDYFRTENMKYFNEWIADLESAKRVISGDHDINDRYMALICLRCYTGQPKECQLRGIRLERITEVLEWCGGSAYLTELPGREFDTWNRGENDYRVATAEEIDIILAAYQRAKEAHEKKVNAYLKRYGLSKVYSWTYWREA